MRSKWHVLYSHLLIGMILQMWSPQGRCESQFLQEAITQYNAGNYQQTLGLLGEAESTDCNNPILHYYKANAFARSNLTDEAIKEYKLTLQLQPDGALAAYCHEALQALNQEPSKGASGQGRNFVPSAGVAERVPEVVTILSDSPSSQLLQAKLVDLQSKYGSHIVFVNVEKDAPNKQSKTIMEQYHIANYPSVLFFDTHGNLSNQLVEPFEQSELVANLEKLARSGAMLRFTQSPTALPEGSHAQMLNERLQLRQRCDQIRQEAAEKARDIRRDRPDGIAKIQSLNEQARQQTDELRKEYLQKWGL
jgi:hypothetical protein